MKKLSCAAFPNIFNKLQMTFALSANLKTQKSSCKKEKKKEKKSNYRKRGENKNMQME